MRNGEVEELLKELDRISNLVLCTLVKCIDVTGNLACQGVKGCQYCLEHSRLPS